MNTPSLYKGYGFPPAIISYAFWLYHRFSLSYRDVNEVLAERSSSFRSGERLYLWRAVNRDNPVIDVLVQKCKNKRAAIWFFQDAVEAARAIAAPPDD